MRFVGSITAIVLLIGMVATAEEILRPPTASGHYYPDKPDALMQELRTLYGRVQVPPVAGQIVGCVVPHSGYEFSGEVAASVFKQLQPGQYDRVIILAPSHFSTFEDCSIPLATGFVTPFGIVPLDGDAITMISYSPLISSRSLRYDTLEQRESLHETEHSIEVLLPFLQERLGYFQLVPLMVGRLDDARRRFNPEKAAAVAEAVQSIMDDRTLLVVSTDLTHFGNDFSYRPFNTNILEQIQQLDEAAMRLIARRDVETFQQYLEETRNNICGKNALHVFMRALQGRTVGKVVGYDASMRMTQNENRSVSYAGIVFYKPGASPLPTRPQANPLAIPLARMPGAATSLAPPSETPAADAPAAPTEP